MSDIGTLPGERLAGLSADLFHKVQKGAITLDELALFNQRKNPFEKPVVLVAGSVITIDRSKPFDPAAFIGSGWKIEEEDKRSLALIEVDLSKVSLETCFKRRETYTTGEERLKRLKVAKQLSLDARVLETLWENQHLIPEAWKEKTNGNTTYIFFDGTVVRYPDGNRGSLCLCWDGGRWNWGYYWLDNYRFANDPSAVLASST